MNDKTMKGVIWVVTGIWAFNMLADMLPLIDYKSNDGINAIFTGVIGLAFAARARRNGKDDDPPDDGGK